MQATERANQSWGVHLNWQEWSTTRDLPAWTNSYHREKWKKQGLILWDDEAQQVTRLRGQHALSLLDHLRSTSQWKERGCVVGRPAWQLSLDNPDDKGKSVLVDTINLSPQQTQVLFDFLVREEERLQQMKAAEEEARSRALSRVYDMLLERAEQGKLK
jgi:hypothetical protein